MPTERPKLKTRRMRLWRKSRRAYRICPELREADSSLILSYVTRLAHYPVRLANLQQFWNCIGAAGNKKEREKALNMLTKSLEPKKRKVETKHEEEGSEEGSESDGEETSQKAQKQ